MFGTDVKTRFDVYIDEIGSGYIDDPSMNILLSKAIINVYEKKVDEYGISGQNSRELEPFIASPAPITPISGTLDITATSPTLPNYYSLISLNLQSPYLLTTITRTAKISPYSQRNSNYVKGTARYPRYILNGGIISLEPANCIKANVVYFVLPQAIDVTDSTTVLLYNEKFIENIIDEAMILAGIKGRDTFILQTESQQEVKNP